MKQARATAAEARVGGMRNGLSQWEFDSETTSSNNQRGRASEIVKQWERETRPFWRKFIDGAWQSARANSQMLLLVLNPQLELIGVREIGFHLFDFLKFAFAFTVGFAFASGPKSTLVNLGLREKLHTVQNVLTAREGELELSKLELARLNTIMDNSQHYHIPADLAAKIYDVALAEGIEPKIAFSLVSIESDFTHNAISPVGALGLTQVMPSTARFFDPHVGKSDLFDPETNLRIGFRFLKELIAKYNGNVDLALSAYNRGPAVVDKVVGQSGDPSNGYSSAVLKGAATQ